MAMGLGAMHIAEAVAGHHAGMPDHGDLREKVNRYKKEADCLLETAARDQPLLEKLLAGGPPAMEKIGSGFDMLTRMLLSCLVARGAVGLSEQLSLVRGEALRISGERL